MLIHFSFTTDCQRLDVLSRLAKIYSLQGMFEDAKVRAVIFFSFSWIKCNFDKATGLKCEQLLLTFFSPWVQDLFLNCCQISPTSLSWLGAGAALYKMELYDDAEVALSVHE